MERKPFPSETQERFIVRLPDGMRDKIAAAAKSSNRSMNSEIVARLESTFTSRGMAEMLGPIDEGPAGTESFAKSYHLSNEVRRWVTEAIAPSVQSVLDAHLQDERELRARLLKQITGSDEIRKLASGEFAGDEIKKRLVNETKSAGKLKAAEK